MKKDSRIHCMFNTSQRPFGPSYGRNRCMEKANGAIFAFLDADDLWHEDYLLSRTDLHKAYPEVGMIYGPAIYFYEDGSQYLQYTSIDSRKLFPPRKAFKHFIKNIRGTPCTGASTITQKAFHVSGGFNEKLRRGEDVAFFLVLNKKFSILYDPTPLMYYRRHAESSTSRANKEGNRLYYEFEFHKWLLTFAKDVGDDETNNIAQNSFYNHLVAMASTETYIKGRRFILSQIARSQISPLYVIVFALDVIFPLRISKKIRARLFKLIGKI